jgi:hypothetical protein
LAGWEEALAVRLSAPPSPRKLIDTIKGGTVMYAYGVSHEPPAFLQRRYLPLGSLSLAAAGRY